MLEIVKNRKLEQSQEVSVYRNLNRKCFSIKDKKTGLVCAYADRFRMDTSQMDEVYYDPYTLDSFINKRTGKKLIEIDLVYFEDGKAYMLRQ